MTWTDGENLLPIDLPDETLWMKERRSERGEENEGQEIIASDDVARNVRCLKASLPATPSPQNLDATQPQRRGERHHCNKNGYFNSD